MVYVIIIVRKKNSAKFIGYILSSKASETKVSIFMLLIEKWGLFSKIIVDFSCWSFRKKTSNIYFFHYEFLWIFYFLF